MRRRPSSSMKMPTPTSGWTCWTPWPPLFLRGSGGTTGSTTTRPRTSRRRSWGRRLLLGRWQSVMLVELDGPRERKVVVRAA
ncbi:MAG TPA: YjbQ family protein [Candidatus Methylomirabilis sp.]|nr:YjbQ family protein [Candidatus Methylomirabilis sp.]